MGDLINLRQARKRRQRERDAVAAAQNRAASGATKAERRATDAERTKAERALDAHQIDRSDAE